VVLVEKRTRLSGSSYNERGSFSALCLNSFRNIEVSKYNKMVKRLIKFGIGLGILLYLIYSFDFRAIINAISHTDPIFIMLSLMVYSFTFLILTIRWRIILSNMGITIPLYPAYRILAGGILLSDLTPSRLGEFARPYLARRYIDTASGFASVVFDKYVDVSTILFLSGLGYVLFYFNRMINMDFSYIYIWFSILLLMFFFGSISLWIRRRQTIDFLRNIFISLHVSHFKILTTFDESMGRINNPIKLFVLCLSLTILSWATQALRITLIASAIGYSPPFAFLILLLPITAALSLIPVSISGLGFVEAGVAALLSLFGIPLYAGISIALLDRGITFLFHVTIGSKYAMDL